MRMSVVGLRRGPAAALVVGLAVLGPAAVRPAAVAGQGHGPDAHAPHWSYEGAESPSHWADLSPEFKTCGVGHGQSPIDIVTSAATAVVPDAAGFAAARFGTVTRTPVPVDIVNNGHTVQIDAVGSGALVIGSERYELQQFHFHDPSEHTVDGRSFPLEAHFVHKAADGKLAVIGVLFEEGAENKALEPFWKVLPKSAGAPVALGRGGVNIDTLLPAAHEVYRYSGSLTTPPCSEAVSWFVMKSHATASAAQIAAFRAIIHDDNRPVQPLNARAIHTDVIH
jgi:carbonic anhydrase